MENTNLMVNVKEEAIAEEAAVVTMELLPTNAEYRDIAKVAKELGIHYVGVKKDALLTQVNEMITKVNNGEVAAPVIEQPTNEGQDESGDTQGTEEGTNTPAAPSARTPRAPRTPVARTQPKKWFEEEGAYPYSEGDVVVIETGKDLIGRKVEVVQPSAKKNAFKGYLLHPVTGQRQKTFLSVDFDRVALVSKAGQTEEVVEPQVEDQEVDQKEAI